MDHLDLTIFDLSPIAMWLQDFSGVKQIFEQWTAEGIEDIEAYLMEDHSRLHLCLSTIHTLRVNQSTLKLYEAKNLEEILESFQKFLHPEVSTFQIQFFVSLWKNTEHHIPVINYTTNGKRLDVQLRGMKLKGYEDNWKCLLMTTEDISQYQKARHFAESLFTYNPTALWIMDFSQIKKRFELLRLQNIENLDQHIHQHPEFVVECFEQINFIDVNEAALKLFAVKDKSQFLHHSHDLFDIKRLENFKSQLLQLWNHEEYQQRESSFYNANGEQIFVLEQLNIFPHNLDDWAVIQVALTDITERKKLENHLHYLGQHDILTDLHNRTYFNEEIERIEQLDLYPVSCIYIDMNGLKIINDQFGHDVGDQYLKNFAEILQFVTHKKDFSISRIGGDEFVLLMPHADVEQVKILVHDLETQIHQHNLDHPHLSISVSLGHATRLKGETLEDMLRRADKCMYINKHHFYQNKNLTN
ncbi:sensor domain-containing diguanylate cyclase [Acinetobacter sp. DSM 11652]|uniref:sensor domain-containing diguanylate cyclase n=1 Tax=Acinetobacter sp. DSM 11652 TaxID=346222 RepID=UPI0008D89C30|nr:sensor domain-containing diguanylate cyclase [Acinetobacter sp. DSM 11652]SEL88031.1 diguanylate cyclase (GGDEF) domain-containing protein [Acinetobacter sp. DSM 11652]